MASKTGHWNIELSPFNRLFRSQSLAKLVGMSIWPNAKEFSESYSMLTALRKWCPWRLDDRDVVCWAIADGKAPRTGALIAASSAWDVHSVDPRLKHGGLHPRIDRLTMHRKVAERLMVPNKGRVVLLATHSHANLAWAVAATRAYSVFVVSLPCCVADNLGKPLRSYDDPACISPKRTVNIYSVQA